MSYDAFLLITSQLAGKKKARVVIQDHVIFMEPLKIKNSWQISTTLYRGEGYVPKSILACISSAGVLRWQNSGAYLKLDSTSHSILLIQEVKMDRGKYIPFKHYVSDFALVASEWKEILLGMAEEDSVSCF